jgi:steroid delta-isomerase-like uncharacterized protein
MKEDNKAVARRWFQEVWNEGREQVIDELLAPDVVAIGLGEGEATIHSPAEFKVFWRNLRSAIPDIKISIEDSVAEGDRVAVRLVIQGTHAGAGLGAPPSGKRIYVQGIVLIQVENGQIVQGWNSWDQLGLLRQIGFIPSAPKEDIFLTDRKGAAKG